MVLPLMKKRIDPERCWIEDECVNVRWLFNAQFLWDIRLQGIDRFKVKDGVIIEHEIVSVVKCDGTEAVNRNDVPSILFLKRMDSESNVNNL